MEDREGILVAHGPDELRLSDTRSLRLPFAGASSYSISVCTIRKAVFVGSIVDSLFKDQAVSEPIRVGIAGWSYPDWNGSVYRGRIKDKLAFMAGFVDMIEINSTFYRPPDPKTSGAWAERVVGYPDFFFSAKLHQEITHEGRLGADMIRSFRDGLAPLLDAGRLRHLLAQFKYDFNDTPGHRSHLEKIKESMAGLGEMVFELRHNSWQSP